MYADDVCIWATGVTGVQLRARLEKALTTTSAYLEVQGLQVSSSKSVAMPLHSQAQQYLLTVGGQQFLSFYSFIV